MGRSGQSDVGRSGQSDVGRSGRSDVGQSGWGQRWDDQVSQTWDSQVGVRRGTIRSGFASSVAREEVIPIGARPHRPFGKYSSSLRTEIHEFAKVF